MGIGFFAPLPLAMMLPFMAGQSMIMGESFGKGFQYGKRKISSMSNEEFNKMDANTLGRELATDYATIIPHLEQAVRASSDFQQMIIQELIKIIPNFFDQILSPGGQETSGGGAKLPPAGIPGFITPIIGPPPSTVIDNPQINPDAPAARKYNANEQWALRWIDPTRNVTNFGTATFKEVSYMAQLRADNQSQFFPEMKSLGASLLNAYNKKKPIPKTSVDAPAAIDASGAAALTKTIALMFNAIAGRFTVLRKLKAKITGITTEKVFDRAFSLNWNEMLKYNQFVQANRRPNLTIDTLKSGKALRIIAKT